MNFGFQLSLSYTKTQLLIPIKLGFVMKKISTLLLGSETKLAGRSWVSDVKFIILHFWAPLIYTKTMYAGQVDSQMFLIFWTPYCTTIQHSLIDLFILI